MNITILSHSSLSYFNNRIIEEADKKGISCRVLNPSEFILTGDVVFHKGAALNKGKENLYILRTPPYREEKDYFHMGAEILQSMGSKVINSPASVEITGNKVKTALKLKTAGVPILRSACVRDKSGLDWAASFAGGYPVFLKTFFGTRGIGVIFCPCRETLFAAAETLWAYYANIFIEEYAEKSQGATVRILVCGSRVIGAIRNTPSNSIKEASSNTELETYKLIRSNFSRGGNTEAFVLSDEMIETALGACHSCGIILGGVDMVETSSGWAVLEINSSPGIKGFESTLNINAAGEILESLSAL